MENARARSLDLASLLRREQGALAEFLVALAAFDAGRGWAELGYASLFSYLHRELHLSKAAAHYRKVAAELIQEVPAVIDPLRSGELCLSSIIEVARVVTPENWTTLLPRFYGRSRREAVELVAELLPDPAPPVRTVVTRVATAARSANGAPTLTCAGLEAEVGAGVTRATTEARVVGAVGAVGAASRQVAAPALPLLACAAVASPAVQASSPGEPPTCRPVQIPVQIPVPVPAQIPVQIPVPVPAQIPGQVQVPVQVPVPVHAEARAEIVPLTADQRRLHVTVSAGFVAKLEQARAARPDLSDAEILEAGLDLLLRASEKRKGLVERPRAAVRPSKPDHVPARVKREVWTRDGGRCGFPLASGEPCGSTHDLQFDHRVPLALGGESTVDNVRIRCGPHNREEARRVFGDALMDRYCGKGRRSSGERPSLQGASETSPGESRP